jgi:carbon storage regulator CsrA
MLVLSRKVGEKIVIGNNITIVVQRIGKGRVALAIDAPPEIAVLRGELAPFGLEETQFEILDQQADHDGPQESLPSVKRISHQINISDRRQINKSHNRLRKVVSPRADFPPSLNPTNELNAARLSQTSPTR